MTILRAEFASKVEGLPRRCGPRSPTVGVGSSPAGTGSIFKMKLLAPIQLSIWSCWQLRMEVYHLFLPRMIFLVNMKEATFRDHLISESVVRWPSCILLYVSQQFLKEISKTTGYIYTKLTKMFLWQSAFKLFNELDYKQTSGIVLYVLTTRYGPRISISA